MQLKLIKIFLDNIRKRLLRPAFIEFSGLMGSVLEEASTAPSILRSAAASYVVECSKKITQPSTLEAAAPLITPNVDFDKT
ncbi:hypothetical protein C0J52_15138 [Blattella germanica]|nr:hypothetical protein C0J52_15138 [Blattella germanica]